MEWIFVVALLTIIITIKWIIDGTQGKGILTRWCLWFSAQLAIL